MLSTRVITATTRASIRPAIAIGLRPATRYLSTSLPLRQTVLAGHIKIKPSHAAGWDHPVYTQEQMQQISIAHRDAKTWSDWTALSAVRLLRWGFDIATGYKHDASVAAGKKSPLAANLEQPHTMTEEKWLVRMIFLESIAGVPGMVGGMVRHLQSLRVFRKDNGWIATLLEEAQNERMHLMTFLQFRDPGILMRLAVLGAQGVFFNLFFLAYLFSPRTCHRFVGYLEEEAVITYTRTIADLDAGKLKKWENMEAPQIAKEYFKLEPGKDKVRDLLLCIRADEAKHREVNHTLANIDQQDINPYAGDWTVEQQNLPAKDLSSVKGTGWNVDELRELAEKQK